MWTEHKSFINITVVSKMGRSWQEEETTENILYYCEGLIRLRFLEVGEEKSRQTASLRNLSLAPRERFLS